MLKILLCGNDKKLIDSFFASAANGRELSFLSTSDNTDDIRKHIQLFSPYAFVFCAENQSEESLNRINDAMNSIAVAGTKFIVIASEQELDNLFSWFATDESPETFAKEMGLETLLEKLMALDGSSSPIMNPESEDGISSSEKMSEAAEEKIETEVDFNVNAKKRILIVDDDVNMLRTLNFALKDNYSVAVASSGAVALKFLEQNKVDLILLDYVMPGMDGEAVLKRIRESISTCNVPVIFLTGVSDKDKIQRIIMENVQGYLLKPVDTEKLSDAISHALEK